MELLNHAPLLACGKEHWDWSAYETTPLLGDSEASAPYFQIKMRTERRISAMSACLWVSFPTTNNLTSTPIFETAKSMETLIMTLLH